MTLSPRKEGKKQTKITDKWLLKSHVTKRKNVQRKSFSPPKPSPKRNATPVESSEKVDECGDDEIIKNSQSSNYSDLKKKIQKFTNETRTTPLKLTEPQRGQFASPGSFIDRLSISEQEINDIYENITDKDSIEMTHDVNTLITSEKLPSNVLEYSPIDVCSVKKDPESESEYSCSANESIEDFSPLNENEETNSEVAKETKSEVDQESNSEVAEETKSEVAQESNSEVAEGSNKRRRKSTTSNATMTDNKENDSEVSEKTTRKRKSTSSGQTVLSKKQKNSTPSVKTKKIKKGQVGGNPEISPALVKRLKNLKVQLQHEVPPQHLLSSTNSAKRPMSKEQTLVFESYGPLKKGPYTPNEDDIIKKNWEHFCEVHNWNVNVTRPFTNAKYSNRDYYMPDSTERLHFVQFLANGLPWRCLFSVFSRFKNLYEHTGVNTGRFSNKEDDYIMKFLAKAPESEKLRYVSILAKRLNRKKPSVWHHYKKLKKRYNLSNEKVNDVSNKSTKKRSRPKEKPTLVHDKVVTNVKWTYPVVKKFLDALLSVTNCNNVKKLKNQEIDDEIWTQVECKTNITSSLLKDFWYLQLHMQLFCYKPIYLNDFKIELINYLHEKQPKKLEDIDWKAVCSDFEGTTPSFLSLVFDHLTKYAIDMMKAPIIDNINEVINYLHDNHIPELMDRKSDDVLPTLDSKLRCTFNISEQRVQNLSSFNNPLDYDNYCNSSN